MTCGKHTYGIKNIILCATKWGAELHVGSFCSIGNNVKIYLGGNHRIDWITTYPFGHIAKKHWKSTGDAVR